jgi:hypothetical protein
MIVVGIYIKDSVTLEYNRVELFNDEKISVNSSIQNVNDISKTYSDFSQTFVVPASKQNNKIFRHWYENSNDNGFSTLTKADAYIEIDTIPFRSGKIQLESCNVKDGQPQDYSITFIGALGSLKDKFNGLFLKDLTDTTYDFEYTPVIVKDKVVNTAASSDIMFPLISSNRYWNYGSATDPDNDISLTTAPIRYNELFPAIKLSAVLNMIANDNNIQNLNFNGSFLSDARFTNAYLWLKNGEEFNYRSKPSLITFDNQSGNTSLIDFNLANDTFRFLAISTSASNFYKVEIYIVPTVANIVYTLTLLKNDEVFISVNATSIAGSQYYKFLDGYKNTNASDVYKFVISSEATMTFNSVLLLSGRPLVSYTTETFTKNTFQTITVGDLSIRQYFPEIKIEDFFSGLLKMFNLTCYSTDGINYTIEQLENYYTSGQIRDITKYIKSDSVNLNRVKTYKKINFQYEKSESLVNVGFISANGIEYGSLFYDTQNEGEEYNIKLPFEDLNFNNLSELLQVGYALKSDLQKYIPKSIILYDYNPTALTTLTTDSDFYFNTNITGGTSTLHTTYKAFGQEYFDGTDTYSLNFNQQQSTLTNEVITNSLYQQYYENYLANIFDSKARLIKVSGILPTSLLTTLKLNDRLIIRDKRYLINTFTTDLTTGEVQFELLTDFREVPDTSIVLSLDAGNTGSYPGTGTLWNDLSEYSNDGTLINGPTFTSTNGGGIVFDGTDDYVSISDNTTLRPTVFTLDVWIKPTSFTNLNSTIIVKPYNSSPWTSPFLSYMIRINDYGTILQCSTNNGTYCPLSVNYSFSTGTIYNIVYTYDSRTGLAISYLNGNQVGTTTFASGNILYSAFPVLLGSSGGYVSTGGNINEEFSGTIYNVNTYNRFLSSTEILENFNGTKAKYGL